MPSSESGTCDLCNTTVQLNKDYPIEVTIKAKGDSEEAEVRVHGKTFAACQFNEQLFIRVINYE